MKITVNILFALVNLVWTPYVAFKTYGWFYDKVGFELPELTFLNIFAVCLILGIMFSRVGSDMELIDKVDKDDKNEYKNVAVFFIYLIALGVNYLIYSTVY